MCLVNYYAICSSNLGCIISKFFLEWGIQLWSIRCLKIVLPAWWNLIGFFSMFEEDTRGSSFVYGIVYSVNWARWVLPIFPDPVDRSEASTEKQTLYETCKNLLQWWEHNWKCSQLSSGVCFHWFSALIAGCGCDCYLCD